MPTLVYMPGQRLALVRAREAPVVLVAEAAQRHRKITNLLFKWKRLDERGELALRASCVVLVRRPR